MKERIEELAREIGNMTPDSYSDSRVEQIITTAVNEALEMAAKECESRVKALDNFRESLMRGERLENVLKAWPKDNAEAIRKLKVN